jgi:hypothetical protein
MGVSVLATSAERAVWLAYGFYVLNLLVPIIPVAIIYRLFPVAKTETRTGRARQQQDHGRELHSTENPSSSSIKGKIGGWEIAAAGTWGSYVTALVLGYLLINNTAAPLIKRVGGASIWRVDLTFTFADNNGKEKQDAVPENLYVEPLRVEPGGNTARIYQWSDSGDPPDKITIKMNGYDPQSVDLTGIKPVDGLIKVLKPITLKESQPTRASSTELTEVPAGKGPPPLTTVVAPNPVNSNH